ncbi:hypothetical protein PR048_024801 [Dryococelus australis]|uniref:Uncharacterized protein n=1 Tax=Dryococelus australis TaxID=614101 RepID=A0ABQ9GPJ6_9NEOP|nr:hypothetical protein PR048_024801 [Dryococelus australis]
MRRGGVLYSLCVVAVLVLLSRSSRAQNSIVHLQEVSNAECMLWCRENEFCIRTSVLGNCVHLLPSINCDNQCFDNETCVYRGTLCWPIPGEYDCPYYCLTRLADS